MPPRRGKAASRQSRQRRANRPARPASPPSPAAPTERPGGLAPAAAAETPERAPERAPSAPGPVSAAYGSSALGERARAEYHYVGRDLRNLAILTAIILAVLIAAAIGFNALGIGPD
jgi:hypothetical protein